MTTMLSRPLTRRQMLRSTALAGMALTVAGVPALRTCAEETPPKLPDTTEALVRDFMKEYALPGFQLTYRRGAKLLYEGCFGEADREAHQPVAPNSLFRIASCSKAFTSAAIFRLLEMGRLTLDDRVFAPDGILRQYSGLGHHRDWLHSITIHHLLTHTCGGWTNDGDDPMFREKGKNHNQLIHWTLETQPLRNPPGEKFAYSNFGYCVLGRVIEHLSGETYPKFVHQEVLSPARVYDMRIGTHKLAPKEVHYYSQSGDNPYDFAIARMDSHGGWIATATDVATFLACLFSPPDDEGSPAILMPESLKLMTTGSAANPGYACGLAINTKFGNAFHSGGLSGTASLMVHTKTGMSWAAICNTSSAKKDFNGRLDKMLWQIARSVPEWKA